MPKGLVNTFTSDCLIEGTKHRIYGMNGNLYIAYCHMTVIPNYQVLNMCEENMSNGTLEVKSPLFMASLLIEILEKNSIIKTF